MEIEPVALAYDRDERIIEDMVEYSERHLLTDDGGVDWEAGLEKFRAQCGPNRIVEIA